MPNPEILALLTAHGIQADKIYGGIPSITTMDVAGMMSGCSECESALLRTKYCGEPIHDAWSHWFRHLMGQGWVAKSGRVDVLSKITLAEHVSDNRCRLCDGTQGWYVGSSYQVCPVCEGSGVVYLKKRDIAQRLGFDSGLKEPWTGRLNWCRRELVNWEQGALQKMS